MSKISIIVDGQTLSAQAGQMLIEVTDQADIHIPRFCYHPKLSIAANCRMCLVEVEKAPKPLPACATPVNDGMVVKTQSPLAKDAQQGTMEFLLINHPLDCPICDQGGECPLQEQSIDYGANASRYSETKRLATNDDIGPLIATWMTRCIHCTRCVRFGEEIAGVMEIGMLGRGEHAKIKTTPGLAGNQAEKGEVDAFLCQAINSELSGNVIELCPVGALTAKPSKYTARVWEMQNHQAVSPFDCVGSNVNIQTLRGDIMRTVVRENEALNACWLSDRDRYAYESVHSDARLTTPMIKDKKSWREVSWDSALKHVAAGLQAVKDKHGSAQIGALANPVSSVEELYLLQKLMRAFGSNHIDHRLRQNDFRDDLNAPLYPGSELEISQVESLDTALLVGSNIRKEQPILGLYLRQAAVKNKATISVINMVDYDFHFPIETNIQTTAKDLVLQLANVAYSVAKFANLELPKEIAKRASKSNSQAKKIAKTFISSKGKRKAIFMGTCALHHFEASTLQAIAGWISDATGCKLVNLPEANAAGAWIAGCIPHRTQGGKAADNPGLNAKEMLSDELHAYVLYGAEPGLDAQHSGQALKALAGADFVVQCASYLSDEAQQYADVLLPIAHFYESAGTLVNCEGRVQLTHAAASPLGEARPGWKVLRVMGNYLQLSGFEQINLQEVRDEIALKENLYVAQRGAAEVLAVPVNLSNDKIYLHNETPMYRLDMNLRQAKALQQTADNPAPSVGLNKKVIKKMGLKAGEMVRVSQADASIELPLVLDPRLPDQVAFIPSGFKQTCGLSGLGELTIEVL